MIRSLDHLVLTTEHESECIRFYTEVMGMRLERFGDVGDVKRQAFHYGSQKINLHVRVIHGRDPHHIAEAQYKAIARALRAATEPDPRFAGVVPSTKGAL